MNNCHGSEATRGELGSAQTEQAHQAEGTVVEPRLTSMLRIDQRDQQLKAKFAAQLGREMAQRHVLLERSKTEGRPDQSP